MEKHTLLGDNILQKALLVFLTIIMIAWSNTVFAAFEPSATLLIHEKIEQKNIPIEGISGWPVQRIDFKEGVTQAQQQEAWNIAKNFDYEKALQDWQKGQQAKKLITFYGDAAPVLEKDGQIAIASVNGSPYIYFQANGETHHILGSASFEISPHETVDALSGEKMQVGDFVIGMIDRNLGNGPTEEESSLHGIWVKWSSVKKDLIKELKAELLGAGVSSSSAEYISGIGTGGVTDMVKNAFLGFGIMVKDGLTSIKDLAVEKFFAKTARIEKLEMVDTATGRIYCSWIENGEQKRIEGECDAEGPVEQQPVEQSATQPEQQADPEEPLGQVAEPVIEEPSKEPDIGAQPVEPVEPTQPEEQVSEPVVEQPVAQTPPEPVAQPPVETPAEVPVEQPAEVSVESI